MAGQRLPRAPPQAGERPAGPARPDDCSPCERRRRRRALRPPLTPQGRRRAASGHCPAPRQSCRRPAGSPGETGSHGTPPARADAECASAAICGESACQQLLLSKWGDAHATWPTQGRDARHGGPHQRAWLIFRPARRALRLNNKQRASTCDLLLQRAFALQRWRLQLALHHVRCPARSVCRLWWGRGTAVGHAVLQGQLRASSTSSCTPRGAYNLFRRRGHAPPGSATWASRKRSLELRRQHRVSSLTSPLLDRSGPRHCKHKLCSVTARCYGGCVYGIWFAR